MTLHDYLNQIYTQEKNLAAAFIKVAEYHKSEQDIYYNCLVLASLSDEHAIRIDRVTSQYSEDDSNDIIPSHLSKTLKLDPGKAGNSLLFDLHNLWLLTIELETEWDVIIEASIVLHDRDLEYQCMIFEKETKSQSEWLMERIRQLAPEIQVDAH
jgi:hypothetical protein